MARASVHWNLQKQTYSIKLSGKPVFYAPQVRLRECEFFIDRRLRAQFDERPTRRTVHALIRGVLVDTDVHPRSSDGTVVRCNPFLFRTFVRASDLAAAKGAAEVVLHADRTIEAFALVTAEP